jgi:glucokinase
VILAGDIGGTNTRLAWFDVVRGALVPGESRTYPSQQHTSLDSVVTAFLRDAPGGRSMSASGSRARSAVAGSIR